MAKRAAPVVEELDEDLELIEDEEETPAPKSKGKNKKAKVAAEPKADKAESTGMGASWLAEYVNEELGTEYTAAHMRVILRKMAADGDLEREVGTDRARYQFTGEKDPIVRMVLKRVRSGEADEAKKERLVAAKSGASSKGRKAAAEDVEEEAPAKPSRRKAKADDEPTPEVSKKSATRRRRTADEE